MVSLLAHAIGEAHRLGIVHRDLKPANVLLVDDETPKVVNFGLAKTLEADSNLTRSGIFVGTPSYAAPEQVNGLTRMIGPAADIYALGAIFYQMLTGRPPFQGSTVLQTLEQVKMSDPVPPSRLQPGLSRDAETICLKCLEKDPQRRYASAAALAEDLDRVLSGPPDPGAAIRRGGAIAEVDPATAGCGLALRCGGGCHYPQLHPDLLAMASRGGQGRRRRGGEQKSATGNHRRDRERGPAHLSPGAGLV